MIDTTPTQAVASASRAGRTRRWRWVAFPAVMVLVLASVAAARGRVAGTARDRVAFRVTPASTPPAAAHPGAPLRSPAALSRQSPVAVAPPVPAGPEQALTLPGPIPTKGRGKFDYAPGRGPVLGKAGPIKQFRVAVERDIGEDVAEFAAQVEATLGSRRSWVGGGQLRLRRVSGSGREQADFTVFLATRESAAKMCRRGGTDIRRDGTAFTSCRTPGKAIINLDRWRLSAPPYVAAKVPLAVYRQYVINHEVGHELGYAHQGCPKRGSPAPVMVQQTLSLRGCVPYAWPRRGNRWHSGPPARN